MDEPGGIAEPAGDAPGVAAAAAGAAGFVPGDRASVAAEPADATDAS